MHGTSDANITTVSLGGPERALLDVFRDKYYKGFSLLLPKRLIKQYKDDEELITYGADSNGGSFSNEIQYDMVIDVFDDCAQEISLTI
ncbi:hypothetical protein NDU88_005983 [Pleurodeles waltl]|uniref:Uncharacterized protein n=1 Tax=Pleurodeles waltl TaxID=8319 RepID=A0AAV7PKF7_PLEWA|nr:hypothetical protein NDU88_005983 [Pleurodeles waltl]